MLPDPDPLKERHRRRRQAAYTIGEDVGFGVPGAGFGKVLTLNERNSKLRCKGRRSYTVRLVLDNLYIY